MIRDVKKYLFFGLRRQMAEFFERAQQMGFIEFLNSEGNRATLPDDINSLIASMRILRREGAKTDRKYGAERNVDEFAHEIAEISQKKEEALEKLRLLKIDLMKIKPFGDFPKEQIEEIEREGKRRIQFFYSKHSTEKRDGEGLIFCATDHDFDFYIAITENGFLHQVGLLEIQMEDDHRGIRKQIEEKEKIASELHKILMDYTAYLPYLEEKLLEKLTKHNLLVAKDGVEEHFDGVLFSVEAYIPEVKLGKVDTLIGDLKVHIEPIASADDERIPTYMENEKLGKVGEDLVEIYDTPATSDKDPSRWVLWFFAFFFGIIVSDGGYGLVFLILTLVFKIKVKKPKPMVARLQKLFLILSCSCIAWGIFTASYFGIDFGPENPIEKMSSIGFLAHKKAAYHMRMKDDVYMEWAHKYPKSAAATTPKEFLLGGVTPTGQYEILEEFKDAILLEFSLLIGCIHVILSLFRYCKRTPSSIGWVFFIIGGYLFFPKIVGATSIFHYLGMIGKDFGYKVGEQMLYGGLGLAVLIALIKEKVRGLEEITKVIQVFSDVLSYLRLYALGLAGMMIAHTFNGIGEGVGLAFGFVIIIVGHLVTMCLAIMGGVIHGLRLNFLEWYHYSFEGGGKKFNPLRILGEKL